MFTDNDNEVVFSRTSRILQKKGKRNNQRKETLLILGKVKNKDIRNQIIQMQITLKSFLKTIEHLISEEEAQFKELCENKEVINLIQTTIEDYYDLERNSTHIKTRKREIVKARQLIYWFMCKYKIGSLSFIGKAIGNKDHATVLNSKKSS